MSTNVDFDKDYNELLTRMNRLQAYLHERDSDALKDCIYATASVSRLLLGLNSRIEILEVLAKKNA